MPRQPLHSVYAVRNPLFYAVYSLLALQRPPVVLLKCTIVALLCLSRFALHAATFIGRAAGRSSLQLSHPPIVNHLLFNWSLSLRYFSFHRNYPFIETAIFDILLDSFCVANYILVINKT